MSKKNNFNSFISILFIFLLFPLQTFAQRNITGVVRDKQTGEILDNVSVILEGTTHGCITNNMGEFSIAVNDGDILSVSFLGYKKFSQLINKNTSSHLSIKLEPSDYELHEIIIKPKKEKYSKKRNPAVEFVENVIKRKNDGKLKDKDYYSYQKYEKLTYALNDIDSLKKDSWVNRKLGFIHNYVDTSEITNKPILNISTKETIENTYYEKKTNTTKHVVEGFKRNGIDEMIPEENVNALFSEILADININDNDIYLFTNKFVSPISSFGPNFYKYYLLDTVYVDGVKCQDLGFVPMVSESMGFTGHLYVTLDSTYFVKKVIFTISQDINLNFINNLRIEQNFERLPDGTRILVDDDLSNELKFFRNVKGIYCRKKTSYKKYDFSTPDDLAVFKYPALTTVMPEAKYRDKDYWSENRHFAIKEKENAVDKMMAHLRSIPVFYYTEKGISWIVDGYVPTSAENSKFDFGPINTTISGNSFEGARFRVGGMTTGHLNPHWFFSGYAAYGTKDGEFKYKGQVEYSFNKKKVHANEFPINSIRASYIYDIDQLGQHYFTNKDNIVLSLKRKSDNRITYLRKGEISYQREHENGFSYALGVRHRTEYSTYCVPFQTFLPDNLVRDLSSYNMTEAEIKLRYAPGEKFYQMKARRELITHNIPIFTLTHITAKKGFLNTDYNFNRTDFSVQKRIWLSAFGYINAQASAGIVWDKVPFTMLAIPNANLSYTIQPGTYSLMNAVEFINDRYVSWDLDYHLYGLILNRIPLIKMLKWREVVNFKGLYGTLSNKNIPTDENGLFILPNGTYEMGKTPYMEVSVGVENILKLIRLDYVWRLNYKNHPNIDKRGIRVAIHLTF